ncbi:MAG TPA: prolyl aminopeptidase [Burkholderiales bacterium]|nr:prolyl aminopeptidase [Burkholderiales bacterium]
MKTAEPALYPPLEPFAAQRLPVGGRHAIHFEQCGNPRGFPALFLHGGPGSHTRAPHRRFFDPQFYRVVLFDQRGCGRSTPLGCTEENTTRHLVEDIEALRSHLALERVMLFGGSWGATLALTYATAHPKRVAGMVLRGVFFGSRGEVDWYLGGLRSFVPEAWQTLAQGAGGDLLARYHALVNQHDERTALAAAQRWVGYEEAVMSLGAAQTATGTAQDPAAALARARVQLHYLVHDCFLEPGELASGLPRLADVPALIVQGRLDMVCPPRAAFELARLLPRGELRLVERGGHSASEPDLAQALRCAADDMRGRL